MQLERCVFVLFAICAASASGLAGQATPVRHTPDAALAFQRVYGPTQPPYGFVQLCDEAPGECASGTLQDVRFTAGPDRLGQLQEINRFVNRAIQPVTDLEHYGVTEYWTMPKDGKGDCEDYALLKRHMLIELGWPVSSMLMTVVRDERGEGHAVLTARTAQGDFILDNKVDEVKVWSKTPYTFVMRQSYLNPRAWISLDVNDGNAPMAISGVKPGNKAAR